MTTAAQYVTIAEAMLKAEPGELFGELIAEAGDAAGLDYEDLDAAYELLVSNSSPCWFCGSGIDDMRVEFWEGWSGEPSFYAHPTCEEKRRNRR